MATEVSTKVTPALHPQNIASIEGLDAETAPYVQGAQLAFTTAYSALESIHAAREAASKDPTLTKPAQVLKVAGHAEKLQTKATKALDSAHANLKKGIAAIEDSFNTPLQQKSGTGTINQEIREHVAKLKLEERQKFLEAAIEQKDERTLTAILGAPHYLSGILPEAQKYYTRLYHEQLQPGIAKRLQVMRTAQEMIEQRGPLLWGEVEKAMGADWGRVHQLRNAVADADKPFQATLD